MNAKSSWRDRLAAYKSLPKVNPIPQRMREKRGDGTIAIPSPFDVEEAMRTVPLQCLATIEQLGQRIASKHGATIGCTVTTGIFAWMVANAAHEDEVAGKPPTPYWRAVKAGGELNAKYPGGIQKGMSWSSEASATSSRTTSASL
jgi:hypothetical protein